MNGCRSVHINEESLVNGFKNALSIQRFDDHRYYHHSRINQSLHLLSAISFVVSYAMLWISPPVAALLAWLVSMVSRQAGHFFFEPKGYDHINQATHAFKEDIKVGYNLQRKVVLMSVWALSPLFVWFQPSFFGLMTAHSTMIEFTLNVGWLWLWVGVVGLVFRMLQLFWQQDLQTGVVWGTKILTDPFHDIKLYYRSPLYVLRGEWIDPVHSLHR